MQRRTRRFVAFALMASVCVVLVVRAVFGSGHATADSPPGTVLTPPTSVPNDRQYPINTQCTPITAIARNECIIVLSTFFGRTRPP